MSTFTSPSIAYFSLAPIIAVFGASLVGVLAEAFVPRAARRIVQIGVALAGIVVAAVFVVVVAENGDRTVTAAASVVIDGPTLFLQGTLLALGLASVLMFAERSLQTGGDAFAADAGTVPGSRAERELVGSEHSQTEVYPLIMFSLGGMLLFPACNNLLLMFVALEVLSLPLYLLCGLARYRRLLSQEAALKYFLLGAFSSAFWVYGLALLYGYAGSVQLDKILDATRTTGSSDLLLIAGLATLTVGLLFKIGAVPFHSWIPDVYQGAPTPVTAFMGSATKVAAFGALLRVYYVAFSTMSWEWRPILWGVAILTMVVGVVLAITQTDVKRLLAYSSIAHVGFILTGFVALTGRGLASVMFYLLAYGFTTIGTFAVVTLVRDADGEATHLSQWAGLGRKSPLLASVFALFLFALAGIPLTSGFTSKFVVFQAAYEGGAVPLVIVGVLASAVSVFFYARVVVLMFFTDPPADGPTVAIPSGFTAAALALGLAVTVVLGVVPQPLLDLAQRASTFVY